MKSDDMLDNANELSYDVSKHLEKEEVESRYNLEEIRRIARIARKYFNGCDAMMRFQGQMEVQQAALKLEMTGLPSSDHIIMLRAVLALGYIDYAWSMMDNGVTAQEVYEEILRDAEIHMELAEDPNSLDDEVN